MHLFLGCLARYWFWSTLLLACLLGAPASAQAVPPPVATEREIIAFLDSHRELFPGFVPNQVYQNSSRDTTYLFLNRNLEVAPGTMWPDCHRAQQPYRIIVIDNPGALAANQYQLLTEVSVIRAPALSIYDLAPAKARNADVGVLAQSKVSAFTGSLAIACRLSNATTPVATRSFTLNDCGLDYHVGIMLGVNASFLSNPTNISSALLPASTTQYTLVADDPTTHQAVTVMALFYPTPRRYDYQYKELSFFQKFNVSVGSQIGTTLLSDVLVGLNYEVAKGLNFGAGGHYGRHRVIIGQPGFEFGKDVYNGGASFSEANNTRQQWDLAWYVGIGLDLRVVGIFGSRNDELRQRFAPPIMMVATTTSSTSNSTDSTSPDKETLEIIHVPVANHEIGVSAEYLQETMPVFHTITSPLTQYVPAPGPSLAPPPSVVLVPTPIVPTSSAPGLHHYPDYWPNALPKAHLVAPALINIH